MVPGSQHTQKKICSWLQENEIKCIVIPFHEWLFAGKLKKKFGKQIDTGRDHKSLKPYAPKRNSLAAFIKPVVAIFDNILMYYYSKWKYRDYDVIIFDRFICATFIKGIPLNYHVKWLSPLWKNIKTDIGLVFDTPIQNSMKTIINRGNHILFEEEQLSCEREEYFKIAQKFGYPIFETSKPFEIVNEEIKNYLKRNFFLSPLFEVSR